MDVKCPQCSAEYDFDEARIPPEGVAVKCSECFFVFRVTKPSAGTSMPAPPPSPPPAPHVSSPPANVPSFQEVTQHDAALPPPAPAREWKIRQPTTGSIFECRELTTLQKWIVEGKVARDDEISLTGETWKRLGNIPELASFFQIVDEAYKARAYDAMRNQLGGVPPPPPQPSSPKSLQGLQPSSNAITDTWREPNFIGASLEPPPPPPPSMPPPPPPVRQKPSTDAYPQFTPQSARPASRSPVPSTKSGIRRQSALSPDELYEEADVEQTVQSSGRAKWVVLFLVLAAAGAATGWYFAAYAPEQARLQQERLVAEQKRLQEEKAAAELKAKQDAEAKAAAAAAAAAQATIDAGVAAADVVDAGAAVAVAPEVVDAGAPKAAEPVTYEAIMKRADRALQNDRPEQALSYFGRASDLKPDRIEPIVGKGLSLLDMGQALAAQASFEQALRTHPKYGPAIMGMAESYRFQKKNAQAVEWYERYLENNPDGSEANVARSNIERLKK